MEFVLPDDYIAGFIDGEGCFALTFRKDVRHKRKGSPTYYSWKASFAVVLRDDDKNLLELIKKRFSCGLISPSNGQVRYEVHNLNDLKQIIIPFFRKHRLYGKKFNDFLLWIETVNILYKYKNEKKSIAEKGRKGFVKNDWNEKDKNKLNAIRQAMSLYKSRRRSLPKWIGRSVHIGRE